MEIGERIKNILDARQMSQKELSEITGISQSLLSKYLSSNLSMRSDVLCKIARALDVSLEMLINGEEKGENAFDECINVLSREGVALTNDEKIKLVKIIMGKN